MKKIIASLLALLLFNAPIVNVPLVDLDNIRTERAEVIGLADYCVVIVETEDGNVWEFCADEGASWEVGDNCKLLLHNSDTPDVVEDDVIVIAY